jgi:hypothetical protein
LKKGLDKTVVSGFETNIISKSKIDTHPTHSAQDTTNERTDTEYKIVLKSDTPAVDQVPTQYVYRDPNGNRVSMQLLHVTTSYGHIQIEKDYLKNYTTEKYEKVDSLQKIKIPDSQNGFMSFLNSTPCKT